MKPFTSNSGTGKDMTKSLITGIVLTLLLVPSLVLAGWDKDEAEELDAEAKEALAEFKEKDPFVEQILKQSFAYAVIPTVAKAGFGIGGARGKGVLYEAGEVTAIVTLSQLSIGFQWGGQAYSEFLFFQDYTSLSDFKNGNYELGAQASAVAVTAGVSADAEFVNGMAIFTHAKGGLMYEASVGGQKFNVELRD
jgi:lipid-binding SYLF domain-containing protein